MLDLLKSAQARRVLFIITSTTALILLASNYFVTVWLDDKHDWGKASLVTAQVLAGGLFGGVAAAAFIAFVTRYLFKHERKLEQTEVIDALSSHREHLEALRETEFWHHNGHIGRWVRTVVLPSFADAAHGGATKMVRFIVIHPADDSLIAAYAEHRRQVDAIDDNLDTELDARVEILATIIRAGHYHHNVDGVNVEVYLRHNLDLFRVDTSDGQAFTTLTRVKAPALLFHHDTQGDGDHYNAARRNFELAMMSSEQLRISEHKIPKEPTEDDIKKYFNALGLSQFENLALDAHARSLSKFNRSK